MHAWKCAHVRTHTHTGFILLPYCLSLIYSLPLLILTSHLIFLPRCAIKCSHRGFECLFCSLETSALPRREFSSDHLTCSPTLTDLEGQVELSSLCWSFYCILKCLLSNRHLTVYISAIFSTLKNNFWSYCGSQKREYVSNWIQKVLFSWQINIFNSSSLFPFFHACIFHHVIIQLSLLNSHLAL